MSISRRPRCTVCNEDAVKPDPFFYDWQGRQYPIYRCTRCTHQFVHPPATPADQALIYSNHYFSKEGDWVCGIFEAGYIEAEPQLREEAKQILAMLPVSSGKLLDVGCAGGVFLDEARRRGFEVTGIELNPSMAEHARNTYRIEVITSRLEEVPADQWSEAFEVVTLLDVLEHIPEPLAAMRKVAHWLRPGGFVLIRGPLDNRAMSRLKEGIRRVLRLTKRLPGYPLDANTFNKRSFEALLQAGGFEISAWIGETASFSNLLARRKRELVPDPKGL